MPIAAENTASININSNYLPKENGNPEFLSPSSAELLRNATTHCPLNNDSLTVTC